MPSPTITGLAGLDAGLARLAQALAQPSLQRACNAAGQVLQNNIAPRIPVRTGKLVAALQTVPVPAPANHAATAVQIDQSQPGGANHDAVFAEYGTSKQAPDPFMRAGFMSGAVPALAAFVNQLQSEIPHD